MVALFNLTSKNSYLLIQNEYLLSACCMPGAVFDPEIQQQGRRTLSLPPGELQHSAGKDINNHADEYEMRLGSRDTYCNEYK